MLELLAVSASQGTAEPINPTEVDAVPTEQVAAQNDAVPPSPPPISAPESTPPESVSVSPIGVTAAPISPPVAATPASTAVSAPVTLEQTYTTEIAKTNKPQADTQSLRRQVLEQRLAEIVQRDRQAIAVQQQNLTDLAMKYAAAGQFIQARDIVGNNSLPPAIQADLIAQIDRLEGKTTTPTSKIALSNSGTETALPYAIEVLAIMRAIVTQESSGNFQAVNPHSGALGFAQIMPQNLPAWSREALGREVSRSDFLQNPAIQLQIIAHRLNKYWQSALASSDGDEAIAVRKVASLWYSGKAHLFNSYARQTYGGKRYPAIAEYTLAVLQRYQREKQNLSLAG